MKRVDQSLIAKGRAKQALDPESLAVDALSYLAGDPDRLGDFLSATGLTVDTLRSAAGEPAFLEGGLGYVASDEGLLVAFAAHRGDSPEEVGQVIARTRRDVEPNC